MTIGIFGYTGQIPDPRFVYNTTYPNRFRGTDWSIPRFGLPFIENPMAKPPFAGLGGCGCGGMQKVGGTGQEDFSGLGATSEELSTTAGFVIGAAMAGIIAAAYVYKKKRK